MGASKRVERLTRARIEVSLRRAGPDDRKSSYSEKAGVEMDSRLAGVAACGYFVLAHFMGGPRDVYGFLRYALPQWHEGELRVGESAPDAPVFSLTGQGAGYLHQWIGKRPLVLIFGSYA
jgi:hypothetical protein